MNPGLVRYRTLLRAPAVCAVAPILLLCACAAAPPEPVVALNAAEQAINTADRERIADQAAPELHEARDKLAAARAAAADKRMVAAEQLAEESRADAELASARSDTAKAQAVNDAIIRGDVALQQEMQRKAGVTP